MVFTGLVWEDYVMLEMKLYYCACRSRVPYVHILVIIVQGQLGVRPR